MTLERVLIPLVVVVLIVGAAWYSQHDSARDSRNVVRSYCAALSEGQRCVERLDADDVAAGYRAGDPAAVSAVERQSRADDAQTPNP